MFASMGMVYKHRYKHRGRLAFCHHFLSQGKLVVNTGTAELNSARKEKQAKAAEYKQKWKARFRLHRNCCEAVLLWLSSLSQYFPAQQSRGPGLPLALHRLSMHPPPPRFSTPAFTANISLFAWLTVHVAYMDGTPTWVSAA